MWAGLVPSAESLVGIMWASLVAGMVTSLPALWEIWALSLAGEDPLEKGMATHSSILAWETPHTEKPGGLQSMDMTERLTLSLSFSP